MKHKILNTIVLKDKSIVNFFNDGKVELYPDKKSGWKKPKQRNTYNAALCHIWQFKNFKQAQNVMDIVISNLSLS